MTMTPFFKFASSTLFGIMLFFLLTTANKSKDNYWSSVKLSSIILTLVASIAIILSESFDESAHQEANLIARIMCFFLWFSFPLFVTAIQPDMNEQPIQRQRIYAWSLLMTLLTSSLALLSTNLIYFYILFEIASLLALYSTTQWPLKDEPGTDLSAIMLYWAVSLLPMIGWALPFYLTNESQMSAFIMDNLPKQDLSSDWYFPVVIISAFFLMKLWLYAMPRWLNEPQDNVPQNAYITLVMVTFTLGGCGMVRLNTCFHSCLQQYMPIFMLIMAGTALATILMCLFKVELKTMIPMFSMSQFVMLTVTSFMETKWSYTGTLVILISHWLSLSTIFCYTNQVSESFHPNSPNLFRSLVTILTSTNMWFMIALFIWWSNPEASDDIVTMMITLCWAIFTLSTIIMVLITTSIDLSLAILDKLAPPLYFMSYLLMISTRPHFILYTHMMPLVYLILAPTSVMPP